MKTGRLIKFHRAGGDVHAYLYREGTQVHAALYVLSGPSGPTPEPPRFSGRSEAEVEESVRAWIARHFPRE
jgi:hypothetical protein